MKKNQLFTTILFCLFLTDLTGQTCLPDGISFTNQSQVNNFKVDYPDCKIIEGNVSINDTGVTNLDSLNEITEINGQLYLNDNNHISFQGLKNVTSLGKLIIRDDALNHFVGLENLEVINGDFEINDCHGIATVGLNSLKEVKGNLIFEDNTNLSLVGMSALEKIGGDLMVIENEVHDLFGFSSIKEIGGQLMANENTFLTSLVGLDSIDANSITELILESYDSLSFCSVKSVCDYLNMDLGPYTIGQNVTGCNTKDEILALCPAPTAIENEAKPALLIYPNPVGDLLQLHHELPEVSEIAVHNSDGMEMLYLKKNASHVNVSQLIAGMYILSIKSGGEIYYFRFAKM